MKGDYTRCGGPKPYNNKILKCKKPAGWGTDHVGIGFCKFHDNVKELQPWETVSFPWGTAIRKKNGRWTNIFISPTGQGVNVEDINVVLHENGIEFL